MATTSEKPKRPKKRISKDEYYMTLAKTVSARSTCLRRQYGAIIVSKSDHILSTGYNGAARGELHCLSLGCERERLKVPKGERYELCVSVHAEANAIIQAARGGASIDGAKLYVNGVPCKMCWRLIKNAGIEEVIYIDDDPESESYGRTLKTNPQSVILTNIKDSTRENC
ncbi:MAG TPA: dCMP deaminase family protein [Candidatus Acidoferrales bacterium]|nr:dCMP deaminase family protein [Candidatus Acidoferrales bacterium]